MRLVIQRVGRASVSVDGKLISSIKNGLMILVGVCAEDTDEDIHYLVKKVINLRIFNDDNGVTNISVLDTGYDILAVSQFTLYASTKKGNRPSYIKAAEPHIARPLYDIFCKELSNALGKEIGKGVFGAHMDVELVNDGPVTILIDSRNKE